MALTQEERDAIINAAANKTKEEFAGEVATRTTLKTSEVLALAKTDDERKTLAAVLDAVTKAASNNKSKANSIRNITGGVEALVKIVGYVI